MNNLILNVDSYKFSHYLQYPPGTDGYYGYLESRGGRYGSTVFFGLQYHLKEYLSGSRIDMKDVEEAATFAKSHGVPFPYEGWSKVANAHAGKLPIRIRAVPEGTVVPVNNVLMTVETTDPELFWLGSWLETMFVRACWYPTTVATQSYYIKKKIYEYLEATANSPKSEIDFKLHDFGARGVSSRESAGIGGLAHLVNFKGSDTVEGVLFGQKYYDCEMAGFSIPAAEHSTITSWGKDGESAAYRNMVSQFGKRGSLVAVVSDSYDIYNAVENLWGGELLKEVQESGATIVIRPDSGNPPEVVLKILQILERKVGMDNNLRGYKVLPSYYKIIQGDGVNEESIEEILHEMKTHGYSASNIAFGMGGALLQQLNRDTQKFAFKCSEITINRNPVPVSKSPVTDPGKKSKSGRLRLVKGYKGYSTVSEEWKPTHPQPDILETVFENGKILKETTLDEVRARAWSNVS
jgi:nicotinamide phosphoribosyltransferase